MLRKYNGRDFLRKNMKMALLGLVTGIANGFFGSGGGIVAVPMLKKTGLEPKKRTPARWR